MPFPIFMSLKEEKKDVIINSAVEEFTKYGIDNAKVVRIIKRVNISRASFYQYFDGIEDLFYYILEILFDDTIKEVIKELRRGTDIFDSITKTMIGYLNNDHKYGFAFNHINDLALSSNELYSKKFMNTLRIKIEDLYRELSNRPRGINSPRDFIELIDFYTLLTSRMYYDYSIKKVDRERVIHLFNSRAIWVKKAFS